VVPFQPDSEIYWFRFMILVGVYGFLRVWCFVASRRVGCETVRCLARQGTERSGRAFALRGTGTSPGLAGVFPVLGLGVIAGSERRNHSTIVVVEHERLNFLT
jgi:hypothetical protein